MADRILSIVDGALREHFHHVAERAAVSFVGVDPIEVLRFEPVPGQNAYVSLGTSRYPMTAADSAIQTADGPRAELLLQVRRGGGSQLWRQLAVLAAAPAVEGVVYAAGMTVDLGMPLSENSLCVGGVVTESAIPDIDTPAGSVQILQILPATPNELAFGRIRGTDALRAKWAEQRTDLLDLSRTSVDVA